MIEKVTIYAVCSAIAFQPLPQPPHSDGDGSANRPEVIEPLHIEWSSMPAYDSVTWAFEPVMLPLAARAGGKPSARVFGDRLSLWMWPIFGPA